jgi:hypothetical protein
MCIYYFHRVHPPTPFPTTSPILTLGRNCSALLFSDFVEEKK